MQDYYALLGIPQFTPERTVIRGAYLKLARFYHPDITTLPQEVAEERMKLLNSVYETLTDPERKRSYDAALRSEMVMYQRRNQPRPQNAQNAAPDRKTSVRRGGFFKRHAMAIVWGMLAVILAAAVFLLILLFRHAAGREAAAAVLTFLR